MKKKLIFILLSLGLFVLGIRSGYGQAEVRKYSNEFLNIGVGSRALGMSNVQVAFANDATSGYWNPAGAATLQHKYEGALMHSEYFAGIAKYDYAGFATPIDSTSGLSFSFIRFAVDDIPDTRNLLDENGNISYDRIRFFSSADYAFLLSYGKQIPRIKGLQLGGSAKIIYRNVGPFANAWGFGFDVGAQYDYKGWKAGVMVRDATTTYTIWTINTELLKDAYAATQNELPENSVEITTPRMIMGIGRYLNIKDKAGVLIGMDVDMTTDGQRNVLIKTSAVSFDPKWGLEANYKKTVYLRAGVGNIQEVKNFDVSTSRTYQPNFGIGIRIKSLFVDYALTDIGNRSEGLYSNVFSIKLAVN